MWCGEKDDSRDIYVNPEGVRAMVRLFELVQVDMVKYEENDFNVIVKGISIKNWTGSTGTSK